MRNTARETTRYRHIDLAGLQAKREAAIRAMGLRAWYSAHDGSSATKMTDISGNGVADATVGAGSNSPLWLPYTIPQLVLPGSSGNSVSCPDSNGLDISGDIEIVAHLALNDWTPATVQCIVSKELGSVNSTFSFDLLVMTDGTLKLELVDALLNVYNVSGSTAAVTAVDGASLWIKATVDLDNGSGQRVWRYYQAPSQTAEPTSWTQVGTDVVQAGAIGAINVSTTSLQIGQSGNSSRAVTGRIHRTLIRNGINGPIVADFDASRCTQTGFTDDYGNPWTVNRTATGRKSVIQSPAANSAMGVWLFGVDDFIDLPTAATPPMNVSDSWTIITVGRIHQPNMSGQRLISSWDKGFLLAGDAVYIHDKTATPPTVMTMTYTPSLVNVFQLECIGRSATSASVYRNNVRVAGPASTAALGDLTPLTAIDIGRDPIGGNFGEFEGLAWATIDRPLTAVERALFVSFYKGGL